MDNEDKDALEIAIKEIENGETVNLNEYMKKRGLNTK